MINLAAIVLSFIVGFMSSYFAQWPPPPRTLWRVYRLHRVRERECYSLPRGKIYIVPSSSSDAVSRYLSEHDMACVEAVVGILRECGYKDGDDLQVYFQDPYHDTVPDAIRTENLILVCSPKRNRLTESVLRDFPGLLTSVRFELSPEAAFTWQGNRYVSQPLRDYALMAIKQNPYNPKRKLVLLFGLRAIGTKGAGSFYAKPGWAAARADIARRFETRSGEIEVLLCVDHTADYRDVTRVAPVAS